MPDSAVHVIDNTAEQRFEATVDGELNVAEYRLGDGVMHMTHTVVSPKLGGRGIGAQLVEAAFAHARAHGLKIDPQCSYVAGYMKKHPENDDLRVR